MTRFTERLRTDSEPSWRAATTHPFTRDLAAATLGLDKLADYLVQDYSFIGHFIRLLDAAVAHAPTAAARDRLSAFRALIASDENTYFLRSFEALGVPESTWSQPALLPVTRRFHDIMAEAVASGSYAAIMTVLVVTEWVYLEWASAVRHLRPEPFYFGEWIDLHANDGFRDFVGFLRDELDREAAGLSPSEQGRVTDLFRRTVELERDFFDAVY